MTKLSRPKKSVSQRPVWPLNAPGLSAPGPAFLALAKARGSEFALAGKRGAAGLAHYDATLTDVIRDALYQAGKVAVNIAVGSRKSTRVVISGHRWGAGIVVRNGITGTLPADGPRRSRVMLVGKMISETGAEDLRHFSDTAGQMLIDTLRKYDYSGEADWYVTSALKIADPGESSSSLKAGWLSEFDHLFQQELRLVKPDFILCVGSDALKSVLGKKATLEKVRGVVQTLQVDMRRKASEPENKHVIQVMACEHPNSIMRDDRKRPRFELDISRFVKLLSGSEPNAAEEGLDHRVTRNERELVAVIRHAQRNNPSRIVAVDAEWHGQHPQNEGAYLRCMQFSWAHKAAACVVLHAPGGAPAFRILVRDKSGKPVLKNGRPIWTTAGGMRRAFQLLTKYFRGKRVVGHFLNADLEWLVHFGLDLREQFAAPLDWTKCRTEGGWDTGTMAHAVEETGIFNLTDQSLRHTTVPRYDVALDAWKAEFCRARGLKASQLEGYGECPEEVLYPYALYDADATRRIALRYAKKLDCDDFGNNCWEAFWITQRASPAALEITRTGLLVNRERLDRLTTVYMQARDNLARKIRTWARWPDLKLNSAHHIRELLYGENFNEPDADGKVRRYRPRGALSLYAMPTITTGKRPRPWESIIGTPAEKTSTPSTNKSALSILFREADRMKVWSPKHQRWQVKDCGKYIADIRNYRLVNQTLQSVLAKPVEAEDAEDFDDPFEVDEDGNFVYDVRLPGAICTDTRVRTFISQLKETGRWSSSRPPLMNFSKRREVDYKQILGESYEYPLRSIFEADEGFTLVEADYIGAELFGMAILSGDPTMIEHAMRNQLPEEHPDYFDIHSYVARLAFGLECEPTKAGLMSVGKAHLRIVAKSVNLTADVKSRKKRGTPATGNPR